MNFSTYITKIFLFFHLFFVTEIFGHGFDASTHIKTSDGCLSIEHIAEHSSNHKEIWGYDFYSNRPTIAGLNAIGVSTTNCYFKLTLKEPNTKNIICTPSQEFYVKAKNRWVAACALKIGDDLLTDTGNSKILINKEFIKNDLPVFTLEIKELHNYCICVGNYNIVTHNMIIPWAITTGLTLSFGEGAAVGATAGSYFGPIGIIAGATLGSALFCLGHTLLTSNIHKYTLSFDTGAVEKYLHEDPVLTPKPTTKELPPTLPSSSSRGGGNLPDPNDDEEDDVHPSTPVYRRGTKPTPKIMNGVRKPTTINGRQYSKHAIERMQERGFTPTVVEDAIKNGLRKLGEVINTVEYIDIKNNITVITSSTTGRVVTVY